VNRQSGIRKNKWYESELEYLAENYPDVKTEILARNLSRSIGSVRVRASEMGLRKSRQYFKSLNRTKQLKIMNHGKKI